MAFEPARRARSRGDFRALDEETSTRRVLRGCWLRKLRILPQPTFARDVARCASLEVLRQLECQSTRAEWSPPVARASQCVARRYATDQEQLRQVDDVPDYWCDRYDTLVVRLRSSRQHPPRETYQYWYQSRAESTVCDLSNLAIVFCDSKKCDTKKRAFCSPPVADAKNNHFRFHFLLDGDACFRA